MNAATIEEDSAQENRRQPTGRRGPLGDHVAAKVGSLQACLVADRPHATAVAVRARLRRGIGRHPGFDYTLADYLAVPYELHELLGETPGDEPTDAEYAVHAAMTLYAVHQQSPYKRMHTSGRGFGTAIADLSRVADNPDGVRRRFAALGTAATYDEALHHLRSLIVMLRDRHISTDYGLLADDLNTMRRPGWRTRIQATWGREFFRGRSAKFNDDIETNEETQS